MRYISVETSDSGDREGDEEEKTDPKVLVTAAVGAVVVGALTAYAAGSFGTTGRAVAFVVFAAASGYYLSKKEVPAEVAGSASYISAVVLLFTPFALYLPDVVLRDEEVRLFAQDVEASNVTIGGGVLFDAGGLSIGSLAQGNVEGVLQLVIWFVVFTVIALVAVILGRLLKGIASGKKEEAA